MFNFLTGLAIGALGTMVYQVYLTGLIGGIIK